MSGPRLCRALLPALLALGGACQMDVPCNHDLVGCENTTALFALDPNCPLTGPLQVTLGSGTESFTELPPNALPAIEHGPQGGTHSFLAVRVENPVPSRLGSAAERLKVDFLLAREVPGACEQRDGITDGVTVEEAGATYCAHRQVSRTVVMGARAPLRMVDGHVEELSMLFQWSPPTTGRWALSATVTDPCGRTGTDKSVQVLP